MTPHTANPEITRRVKQILRRDLKLGSQAEIADDMPLMGGEFEIDSLDVVLLVSSIEKEFGIKLPKQAASTEVFADVGSMVRFLETQTDSAGTSADRTAQAESASPGSSTQNGQPKPSDSYQRLLTGLPHAEPFRFVSRLTAVEPGTSAEGTWHVSGDEAFFAGHFPNQPIVPGVLISEALAQISGLVTAANAPSATTPHRVLAHVDVRFHQPVMPPAAITLKSRLERAMPPLDHFSVRAEVEGHLVAQGNLTLHDPTIGGSG